MHNIKISLSYDRYNQDDNFSLESYSNNFCITDEDTYYTILEKVEVMLKSLGYEFDGHLEFSGLVASAETQGDNIIQLHPDN